MHGLLACMRFAEEEMVCFDSAPAAMVITRTVVERLSGLFRPGGLQKPVRMRLYRAMGFLHRRAGLCCAWVVGCLDLLNAAGQGRS